MNQFIEFVSRGFTHITDPNGYDHILFILAFCTTATLSKWKPLIKLVTAFTIGHSIALVLASYKVIKVSVPFVEWLIPVTIILSCLINLFSKQKKHQGGFLHYNIIAFFGIIHGLGFSNFLKYLVSKEESITFPLFYFNIGLEIGQLCVVCLALLMNFVFLDKLNINSNKWNIAISSILLAIAAYLAIDRSSFLFQTI